MTGSLLHRLNPAMPTRINTKPNNANPSALGVSPNMATPQMKLTTTVTPAHYMCVKEKRGRERESACV